MRTHWRIKPYSCPECHRNFVRQDALTRHLRLDFGHNRCSGYPGPLPGNADQGEKDGDDDEEDMMEDDEDFPDLDSEEQNQGSNDTKAAVKNTTTAAAASVKADPSPALPSPTSPTSASHPKVKTASTTAGNEQERERPLTISTAAANALHTSSGVITSATKEAHPTPRTSDSTQAKFDREGQERSGRGDASSPHARHSSSATPMSFVHMADRPVAVPEVVKETSGQPHTRSYSHSAYNYGPTTPLTIQTGNMPLRPTKHLERRATAPLAREGESWMGHGQGQGYSQEPASSPVDEYPRGGPGYGSYRHEMDRPRSATHLPPDYPTSPKDIRRSSPGPPSAQGEWHARSGPPSAHWGWSNTSQPSQDSRLRHPTWSSSPLPPHAQDPSSMQPPHSPVESWSRGGHPPSSPHDDPRKSSIRSMARYGSSPYPIPEHGSGGAERHHRGSSGPMSPVGPLRPSDPYRRGASTADMDRVGTWSEQRSRSFHGAEGMQQDPRSRYDSVSSLPPTSSAMSAGRSPVSAEAVSSSSAHGSERSHSVSGMVGVERMYPPTSVGGGPFHDREQQHPSGSIPLPIKTSMAPGDPNGREYRPTRSQSMMDYDADRMAAAIRRSRYPGDPKMMLREERRSMSPPGHRLPIIDTSRSYEGGGPRYPYSAGAERPPSGPGPAATDAGSACGSYPREREEMDDMQQARSSLRRDEGGVPGGGAAYYDEPPRSATFQRTPHGY
ncbi:hypothetical protein BGZ95_006395 [Linnemannia exigua]|uniref:C2H2-type domain-containing protein n=1 Tax=Linnemannia exigua TaxID=604196 RepID=A0AAD4GZU4_9FUNG|nr:hypothetical protein BGZ95_006395 [Linnemannia exigua]